MNIILKCSWNIRGFLLDSTVHLGRNPLPEIDDSEETKGLMTSRSWSGSTGLGSQDWAISLAKASESPEVAHWPASLSSRPWHKSRLFEQFSLWTALFRPQVPLSLSSVPGSENEWTEMWTWAGSRPACWNSSDSSAFLCRGAGHRAWSVAAPLLVPLSQPRSHVFSWGKTSVILLP